MAWTLKNFSAIEPGERDVFGLDFVNNVGTASIVSGIVTCRVKPGGLNDPSAASRVSGTQMQGTAILWIFSGGVDGVDYILEATATLSDARVISQWAILRCRAAPTIH